MADRGKNAFAIGDLLDRLERCAKDVARSLDSRNRLDIGRLRRVRDNLSRALGELDDLISAAGDSPE
jgi:hypothetical protein